VYDESHALSRRLTKIELEIKALKKATDSKLLPRSRCNSKASRMRFKLAHCHQRCTEDSVCVRYGTTDTCACHFAALISDSEKTMSGTLPRVSLFDTRCFSSCRTWHSSPHTTHDQCGGKMWWLHMALYCAE
jgi:hypothetical protein